MTNTKRAPFTKGQEVFAVGPWNDKNTFCVVPAVVASCGLKRMVLVARKEHALSNAPRYLGRNFIAGAEQWPSVGGQMIGRVIAGDLSEATAVALELAGVYLEWQKQYARHQIEHFADRAGAAYIDARKRDLAELETLAPAVTVIE